MAPQHYRPDPRSRFRRSGTVTKNRCTFAENWGRFAERSAKFNVMHAPQSTALIFVLVALSALAAPLRAQVTSWSAFNDFYVNVPATGGGGDYNQSTWISSTNNPFDTGLTNANAWGYAGGNFNGGGFPSSVGTYVSGGGLYPLTSGGTYAGSGASYNLGGGNFWIGYNDNYGSVGLPNGQTQIGKYTKEWFSGSPNYANNADGVNNKYLWVQSTGLSPSTDGLGAIVSWTAPTSGTFYFSGSYVNGNYGQTTDFAIVDSTGATLLAKTNLAASSSVGSYGFNRTLSAGDVVQYQVATPAAAQGSPLGLEANIAVANWNAYNDFYLAPTAAGWTGATTPGTMGAAWGYYDANVNGFGLPTQIGSFFTADGTGSGSQNLYKLSTNSPLGSASLVGASGWFDTGGAGFPVYTNSASYPWGTSLGRYDTPWFEAAPPASNRIWLQASQIGNTNAEGIAPVLSWTAPVSGYYTVDGSWVVGNTNAPSSGASLAIADSSGLTYDRYSAATGSSNAFTYTTYYAAGSVIQFQVGSDFKVGAPVGLAADVSGTSSSNTAYFVNTGMSAKETSALSGPGGLTKSGAGSLTLSGNNTYSGATTVGAGTLIVNGTNASATTVQSGATLAGSGSVRSAIIQSGGTIAPGNSPGTMTLTNGLTWAGGGNYNWQIFNVSGTAGQTNAWDWINVTGGTWDITGLSSSNKFNINLWSLSGLPDTTGLATGFDAAQNYSWKILSSVGLSTSFNSAFFNINTNAVNGTGGFVGATGIFSLAVDGNDDLFLNYTAPGAPVPEPGTWAAAALLALGAAYARRRRNRARNSDDI